MACSGLGIHPEKDLTADSTSSKLHPAEGGGSRESKPPPTLLSQDGLVAERRRVLDKQIKTPEVNTSFFTPYRYADISDWIIIAISIICAIAAGAALPLLAILFGNLATAFQKVSLDTIPYDHFESELIQNVLYFIYIGVAEFITIYISMVGFIYTGEHITLKIRQEYMKAILRQNIAFFDNLGAGEVTTRITADMNLIQDGISQKVGLTFTAIATFTTAFVIAYVTYWKLALICSSVIVCLLAVMGSGGNFIVKFNVKLLQNYAIGGSAAEEVFNSIRTATALNSQEHLARKYEAYLNTAEKDGVKVQMIQSFMVGSIYAVMFMNYGLGFWQGSAFLVNNEVDVGKVLTIVMAISNGSYALGNVAPNNQAFTKAVAAAAKVYNTIDRQSPLDPMTSDGRILDRVEGFIELRNVTHIYPSRPEVVVMDGINLSIPAGRTTALVGASGSGKSTIVGLVERFYSPVQGELYLDGHNIQSLNLRWLRQQISLVSQEPILFSTTIFENIKYGLIGTPFEKDTNEKLREMIEEAATMANAHNFITSLPDGYETNVGSKGSLLSGGQKQRVAIARAIISNPKILLLDEATAALDTKSEGVVQAALDKAAEGRTTIIIAHQLSTIKKAHNIVLLANGEIREQGTHDELLSARGEYFKLSEAQRFNKGKCSNLNSEDYINEDDGLLAEKASRHELHSANATEQEIARLRVLKTSSSVDDEEKRKFGLGSLILFVASFNRLEFKMMICGFIFAILAGGGQPVQAVLYAKSINSLSLPESLYGELRHEVNFWALMLLLLGIIQFILYVIQGICLGLCAEKLTLRARSQAFRTILRQEIAFFDRDENRTGALTSFLSSETNNMIGISGATLGTLLMVSTTFTSSILIALAFGWKLALVCISIVPVLLFCGFYRVKMLAEFQARSREAYDESASYACEATSAIRTVASLTKENDVMITYNAQLGRQLKKSVAPVLKSTMFYALSQALTFSCMALAFWYGGTLLGKHEYSIFQFFVCFSQVIFGAQAAGSIFSNAPDIARAINAATMFKRLFDRCPAIDVWSSAGEEVKDMEGTIEFRDVHFRYPTRPDQPVLSGLNLTVKPGQYVALVGGSGCGKSTTISLLERFYDTTSGGVYVNGREISSLNLKSYRSHLALVGQEPTLYQGTIRDNILLGTSNTNISAETIKKVCKDADIYDFIMSLPEGMDTVVGSQGSLLSGGQKQRVAIARALIRNPKILLLDEATSALDSESESVVQAALDMAARGRTTIAVAHRLSTIQKADTIYVLEQGRVVESGNHQELIKLHGRYYELVNMQSLACS